MLKIVLEDTSVNKNRGFTLIELLIVVAIIGIIAAIAVPNFLDGLERARQKKSVGEIRTMVIAMQTFGIDFGGYPNNAAYGNNQAIHISWPTILDDVGDMVIFPSLLQDVPKGDGWKEPYYYFAGPDGTSLVNGLQGGQVVAQHYTIYSLGFGCMPGGGTDGSAPAPDVSANWCQDPPVAIGVQETYCYQSDIVWGDSSFQQSPTGKQRRC
jgi:type II secretion system protein G